MNRVWFMANARMMTAAINTRNAKAVSGTLRREADGGNCPVMINEGMIAWAVSIESAKVKITGM